MPKKTKVPPNLIQLGRLAMRVEGQYWHAYYALPDTMKNAVFLASISLHLIAVKEERKDQFMALCKELIADLVEDQCGTRPTWPVPPKPAPESERGGNA